MKNVLSAMAIAIAAAIGLALPAVAEDWSGFSIGLGGGTDGGDAYAEASASYMFHLSPNVLFGPTVGWSSFGETKKIAPRPMPKGILDLGHLGGKTTLDHKWSAGLRVGTPVWEQHTGFVYFEAGVDRYTVGETVYYTSMNKQFSEQTGKTNHGGYGKIGYQHAFGKGLAGEIFLKHGEMAGTTGGLALVYKF